MYDERPIALYVSLLLSLIAIRETQWFRLRGRGRRRSQALERVVYTRVSRLPRPPPFRGRYAWPRRWARVVFEICTRYRTLLYSVWLATNYNTERILYSVLLYLVSYIVYLLFIFAHRIAQPRSVGPMIPMFYV